MTEPKGRERRLKPRFSATLPCAVELPDEARDILFPGERMQCRTRDLSESGVGLVAPSIYVGYACVVDEGRALKLTIELPDGPVVLGTTAAHYLRAGGGETDGYLIGMRITSASDEHRARYVAYLETLNAAEQG
ncbi:MAG TPA: PilZ domain-containing protein [Pyrinomonadaceae bacterium]|nr:PilZ domain-containing protein [Pyrinomonadaceae bacterium]